MSETLKQKAKIYSGNADVMCLHSLAQPLVSEMQKVIRFQRRQLDQVAGAIEHTLERIKHDDIVRRRIGVCTETFEVLTAAYAEIQDLPVDQVRDGILPGSAAIHRPRREEAA